MSNTITVNLAVSGTGNGSTAALNVYQANTQVGNNFTAQTFVTSTSGAAVPTGGASTYGGYVGLKNNDDTDNILIYQDGATATVLIGTLTPGDVMLIKPAAALGCKASANTPELVVFFAEP